MKFARLFTVVLAVAAPSAVLAHDDKPDDLSTQDETTTDIDTPKGAEVDKDQMKLRANVVPAVAGIEAADEAIDAIYELTGGDTIDVKDVRDTVALARQGISLALDRAESLDGMTTLSEDADSEANRAVTKLKEADTTLAGVEKQLKKGELSRAEIGQVHDAARDLHQDLSDASNAVERVAKAYDMPADFEFEG